MCGILLLIQLAQQNQDVVLSKLQQLQAELTKETTLIDSKNLGKATKEGEEQKEEEVKMEEPAQKLNVMVKRIME